MFTELKKAKRTYVLKARAERAAETRLRIVEAMVQLHQEVGPAKTTVSAIAERAGVERLTVYRHFRSETEMLDACSGLYFQRNPPPHPGLWTDETDPLARTSRGLQDIYAFFSRTAPMFDKVYRDVSDSEVVKKVMDTFDGHLRNLADDLASVWPPDPRRARRTAILRHAVKFQTWHSLEADDVANPEKVQMFLEWLDATPVTTKRRAAPAR